MYAIVATYSNLLFVFISTFYVLKHDANILRTGMENDISL